MTYKRAPGTVVCNFCGREELEVITGEGEYLRSGWGTVEWRKKEPAPKQYDYEVRDACPACLQKILATAKS